jgi:hypothetical protein
MPAQIREDDTITRGQNLSRWQPKFVIDRKRMEQNYRRPTAEHAIEDLRVPAFELVQNDRLHGGKLLEKLLIVDF